MDSMDNAYEFIDQSTVKKAWLDTKLEYVKKKGNRARKHLLTYRRVWVRRYFINSYLCET